MIEVGQRVYREFLEDDEPVIVLFQVCNLMSIRHIKTGQVNVAVDIDYTAYPGQLKLEPISREDRFLGGLMMLYDLTYVKRPGPEQVEFLRSVISQMLLWCETPAVGVILRHLKRDTELTGAKIQVKMKEVFKVYGGEHLTYYND